MAVSVRLDPVIEAKLTQQANLLGITKSEFIKDAIERVLGMKDPAARRITMLIVLVSLAEFAFFLLVALIWWIEHR